MKKFIKLVQNENKKEMKKISTKIFIILALASMFLAVGFVMLIKFVSNMDISSSNEYWKEYAESQIDTLQAELSRAKEQKDEESAKAIEAQIEVQKYALKNEIDMFSFDMDWKAEALNNISQKVALKNGFIIEEKDKKKIEEQISKIYKVIEDNDFQAYMNLKIQDIEYELSNKSITKDEFDLQKEIIELKKKYEIGKDVDSNNRWKQEIIGEIEKIKNELRTNYNEETRKILSYKQRQEKEETLKIDMYRLENNLPPITQTIGEANYRNYYEMVSEEFSMAIVAILIIIMAGSSISSEFSKGTIKFLVMTPNKRWKILLAKIVNTIIIMLVLTIVLSFVSMLIGQIFFGKYDANPYLYVKNGEVISLNYWAYTILRFLTYDIDIFMYLLFAFTLSVITKNTAISTAFTIATYLGSQMVMTILNVFVKADWLKFIPFNNMSLTNKIFTNTTTLMTSEVSSALNNVSVKFSLIVLMVTAILLIVTMFDSFNKRDIK